MNGFKAYTRALEEQLPWRWFGRVTQVAGQVVESAGPVCSVGDVCTITDTRGHRHAAEVIGFRKETVLLMPLADTSGICFGDHVSATGTPARVGWNRKAWLGRVMDGAGKPIDGLDAPHAETWLPLRRRPCVAMDRPPIDAALATGVRAIDGLLTVGRGQRVGVFGGSGVGKSTLIGMMTRNTSADVVVIGLIGERGREVPEFLRDGLGEEGMRRAVTIVSTSDESPLMRMHAALTATAVAEAFAQEGKDVLLVMDSLTRYAMAAREIGLAAGEPPVSKGYTPSVFALLAQLVERAGRFRNGSITAFYTVLMEGDDQQDPIVDAVRSFLDGHIVLSREMASEGTYPPIAMLDSLSRLMPAITTDQHRNRAGEIRRMMAAYARSADMVRIGAYKPGSDTVLDQALRCESLLRSFLMQTPREALTMDQTIASMLALDLGT